MNKKAPRKSRATAKKTLSLEKMEAKRDDQIKSLAALQRELQEKQVVVAQLQSTIQANNGALQMLDLLIVELGGKSLQEIAEENMEKARQAQQAQNQPQQIQDAQKIPEETEKEVEVKQ